LENTACHWKVDALETDGSKGTVLTNTNTQQQICLIDAHSAPDTIKNWAPSTVVIQCGADKLLSQMKSSLAPTNRTDVYGCCVGLAWTAAFYASPLWPANLLLSTLTGSVLAGLNATFLFRTFMHPHDGMLKKVFGATKKVKANLVLGDWLLEDYDERLNQVSYFDQHAENAKETGMAMLADGNNALAATHDGMGGRKESSGTFKEFMNNAASVGTGTMIHQKKLDDLSLDDVAGDWMKSYRDAVNNRRVDLLAQVLNNCEGEKILMSVDDIDNMKASIVSQLIQRRLTGEVEIGKPVLKYDTYYERVQVDM